MAGTETRGTAIRPTAAYGTLHWLAVALAAVTGAIHVYLGVVEGILPFTIAGVGFFVGIAVFLTRYWRRWFYLLAAVFTLVQIVLWIAGGTQFFTAGAIDKAVQAAFVAVVLYLYRVDE